MAPLTQENRSLLCMARRSFSRTTQNVLFKTAVHFRTVLRTKCTKCAPEHRAALRTRHAVAVQGRVLLFNYWVCYCILKARKPRFQPLEPPIPTADSELSPDAPAFVPGGNRLLPCSTDPQRSFLNESK